MCGDRPRYGGRMARTLLVTNDFPPRPGGIQSYLEALVSRLPADDLVVYAPRWRGDSHLKYDAKQPFPVVRHPTTLMLPTPFVARRAQRLIREYECGTGGAARLYDLLAAGTALGAATQEVCGLDATEFRQSWHEWTITHVR